MDGLTADVVEEVSEVDISRVAGSVEGAVASNNNQTGANWGE